MDLNNNNMNESRREFVMKLGFATVGLGLSSLTPLFAEYQNSNIFFEISLAEWSLNKTIRKGLLDNLDFPAMAKNDFGINAVEYVDQFFRDKAEDMKYLAELKKRSDDLGVRNVLIMVDTGGPLSDLDESKRRDAVESHYKWIDAAKFLGCHSIRVNLRGSGTAEEMSQASIDGLGRLSEYGAKADIGVIVENHGGYSSDGKWLANVMKKVNNPYCGTLPDFDNFCIERSDNVCINQYDRYLGVHEMTPFAKGFSAKSRDFDAQGDETTVDYMRMLRMIKNDKTNMFKGFIGIEYSGNILSEDEGILATKLLLNRVGQQIS